MGAKWTSITKKFKGKSAGQIKNRFYSTLRRVAIKKTKFNANFSPIDLQSKAFLLQFVDDALEFGHNCSSKRGRKKKNPFEIKLVSSGTQLMLNEPKLNLPDLNSNKTFVNSVPFSINPQQLIPRLPSIESFGLALVKKEGKLLELNVNSGETIKENLNVNLK